jgi:hypothetical protein
MPLSPWAGGVGLTLTPANRVVHLARWWNPATEDQCTGPVPQIVQENPVAGHIPLAALSSGRPTFDDNLHALLGCKRLPVRNAPLPPDAAPGDLAAMLDDSLG